MTAKNCALALALGALGASLFAPYAEARSYTIETGKFGVTKLGPLNTRSSRTYTPTIRRAIRAFGQPSSSFKITAGEGCAVKWKPLGLRMEFYNFGVASSEGSDCEPDIGRAQSFTIKRSRKWRTWKGLRIGMDETRVSALHPSAFWVFDDRFYDDGYWLRSNYSPFGDGGEYPILAAYMTNGDSRRVKSFGGWIGAAGE
jgi:hypothetical protein